MTVVPAGQSVSQMNWVSLRFVNSVPWLELRTIWYGGSPPSQFTNVFVHPGSGVGVSMESCWARAWEAIMGV